MRNIPTHLNNIAHLNNHFARFGTLVNVQVQFEGDPASALVTFSSNREAEASINSADAVLGNRFIKMFYHYDKSGGGGLTSGCFKTGGAQRTPVKDRLGPAAGTPGSVQKSPGEDKVQFEGHSLTKTIANPSPKTEDEKRDFLAKKLEEKELVIQTYCYGCRF